MNQNDNEFCITYSAGEHEEIKRIRERYVPREQSKIDRLRRLDRRVNSRAEIAALVLGIVGALIFGGGMSAVLVLGGGWLIPGIITGVVGMIVAAFAYPAYMYVLKREKNKVADEILRLADELIK